jgi:hypothetical protein
LASWTWSETKAKVTSVAALILIPSKSILISDNSLEQVGCELKWTSFWDFAVDELAGAPKHRIDMGSGLYDVHSK